MEKDLELVKRCLTLISRIAARGASSPVEEHVFDTLMELRFALKEQPLLPHYATELERLHRELDFIDSTSEPLTAELILKYAPRITWN